MLIRNPFNQLRNSFLGGEEKMAYEDQVMSMAKQTGQLIKPRTFREQIQDQIAHHESKIKDLQSVLDSMTPEVEKFVEALQKANL